MGACGVLAGIAGAVDYFTIERARTEPSGRYHALGNAVVLGLAVVSLLLRVGDMEGAIAPWGLALSV
ncbi:MAG: DUF2231 domain-containing protein, partial [Actinobacteria bacterium]|nr:DUF2231 domain-containing protein [Actinomycetota bacterium]